MTIKSYMKNYLKFDVVVFVLIGAFFISPDDVMAQDDTDELRPKQERILNHFDKNGDGVLNDREKYHARKAIARKKHSNNETDVRPDRRRPHDRRPGMDRSDRRITDHARTDRIRDARRDRISDVRPDRVRDVRPDRARNYRRLDRNHDGRLNHGERTAAKRIKAARVKQARMKSARIKGARTR